MPKKIKMNPLTLSEVKTLVYEQWKGRLETMTLEQKRLFEYLAKFARVEDAKMARRAVKRLMKEIGLKEEDAIVLVNVLPKKKEEITSYLYKDYPLMGEKEYEKILNILKEVRGSGGERKCGD